MTDPVIQLHYTIIIPVKAINAYIRETIPHILRFDNDTWDIIILPNEAEVDEWQDERIRIIPTGKVSPARKRDIGARHSEADILVFLDDDSYPEPDLLDVADRYFGEPGIVALGGPAITPRQDSFWQKVSGAVFLSRLSGGFPERYVAVGEPKLIDDWPSVNLMVRRNVFLAVGGFDNDFWPGEDTQLCLKLLNHSGRSMLYVPDMVVWHHRREGLLRHLKQIGAYARHRGYFARFYPENSRRLIYFIPTLFASFVMASLVIPFVLPTLGGAVLLGWAIYALALAWAWAEIKRHESTAVASVALIYIVLTHFWYGIQFAVGISRAELNSELR